MNISSEMDRAKEELSTFLVNQPKVERYYTTNVDLSAKVIHGGSSKLTEETMKNELKNNGKMASEEPRNFYDYTKNSDTANSFMGQYAMHNTGFYRMNFEKSNDPLAQDQVRIANDCSYRAMHQAHTAEKLKAEPEQMKAIEKKHNFEIDYFTYREGVDNPNLQDNQKQILKENMNASYKDYKANKLGYDGVDRVFKNGEKSHRTTEHTPLANGMERRKDVTIRTSEERREAIVNDKLPPKVQVVDNKQAVSSIQEKMLAMRNRAQTQGSQGRTL